MLLGCIADDLTGATDLALTLVHGGMRTVQVIGVPARDLPAPDADAVVVALKSRTNPAAEAVEMSLAALDWLQAGGAAQIFFKYCSTFDSTDAGNIGPVAEALAQRLGGGLTIACPAFPTNGRTVYQGHLFVNDVLLSDSPMRHHPLTPMTDSDLRRVLQRQTALKVGHVPYLEVERGPEAIVASFAALTADGTGIAVVDAIGDRHLVDIGSACADMALVTGGSGVAMGLPENFRRDGRLTRAAGTEGFHVPEGPSVILSGSCSAATRAQVERASRQVPTFRIDVEGAAAGQPVAEEALAWAAPKLGAEPILIYSSAPPEEVERIQERFGREAAGAAIERTLAKVARALVDAGARRLVVAGGETSGAVVEALGVRALEIGPEIDPGVPWTRSLDGTGLGLALKSGNFGGEDFMTKALETAP